jgi:hypothetical protein
MDNQLVRSFLLSICLCLIFSIHGYSQTPTDSLRVKIQTKDGNRYIGLIVEEDDEILIIDTESIGEIRIRKAEIQLKRPMLNEDNPTDALNWYENNLPHRYVMLPTGIFRGGKGTGSYYENRYVLINHVHLQMSKGFSIGIGLMPTFVFDGAGTPFWIVPRFRIKTKNKKLHLSTSLFHGQLLFDQYSDGTRATILFGMATYGNDDISFSMGTGYGRYDGYWIETPALAFGGTVRAGSRLSFFIESLSWNIGVPNRYDEITSITMMGARAMWNKFSLDFGFIMGYNDDEYEGEYRIPYLGVVIPFGR